MYRDSSAEGLIYSWLSLSYSTMFSGNHSVVCIGTRFGGTLLFMVKPVCPIALFSGNHSVVCIGTRFGGNLLFMVKLVCPTALCFRATIVWCVYYGLDSEGLLLVSLLNV